MILAVLAIFFGAIIGAAGMCLHCRQKEREREAAARRAKTAGDILAEQARADALAKAGEDAEALRAADLID